MFRPKKRRVPGQFPSHQRQYWSGQGGIEQINKCVEVPELLASPMHLHRYCLFPSGGVLTESTWTKMGTLAGVVAAVIAAVEFIKRYRREQGQDGLSGDPSFTTLGTLTYEPQQGTQDVERRQPLKADVNTFEDLMKIVSSERHNSVPSGS